MPIEEKITSLISVVPPGNQDFNAYEKAIEILELISRELGNFTINHHRKRLWRIKCGPIDLRHENFVECVREFAEKSLPIIVQKEKQTQKQDYEN